MGIEGMLPEALRQATGQLPTEPSDWGIVSERALRRRRRRRRSRQVAGAVTLLAAVLISVVFVTRGASTQQSVQARPESGSVVAELGRRLVVLAASDGHIQRTLASAPRGRPFGGGIAVSAKTGNVYYTLGEQCGPLPQIWRIPISRGVPHRVASVGTAPAVSPDGRFLAYSSSFALGSKCLSVDTLVVRDLRTGKEQRALLGAQQEAVSPLAWWPDSRHLEIFIGSSFATVRVQAKALRVLATIRLLGNGVAFLPTGEAITAIPGTNSTRIVTFDPTTGTEQRTIVVLDQPLVLLGTNSSGTSFLLITLVTELSNGSDLYRADLGNPQPIRLAPAGAAAWLAPGTSAAQAAHAGR